MANLYNHKALSFNDILLVPQYSDVESRLKTDVSTYLTPSIKIEHPVISTNMSTVTEENMLEAMYKTGSLGFLHRFMRPDKMVATLMDFRVKHPNSIIVPSVGTKDEDCELVDKLMNAYNRHSALSVKLKPDAILIDIAHGHSNSVKKMIKYIKNHYDIEVIAGNVATGSGALYLADAGADAVRVGVGGGSVCSTRTQTAHGVPTLTSIMEAAESLQNYNVKIIGDGGFTTSGDIVKALAFGADTVTLGGMLGGTSASPGDVFESDGKHYKIMYGMSSKTAQEHLRGGMKKGIAAEGVDKQVLYKGNTEDVVEEIIGGIRSGLTYSGARTITELRDNSEYIILTPGSMKESKLLS